MEEVDPIEGDRSIGVERGQRIGAQATSELVMGFNRYCLRSHRLSLG